MRSDVRADAGFTLGELMVVLALLSFVLAAVYAASQAMMVGGRANEVQAEFARDSGEPMRIVNKALMQATSIETALPYQIMVTTDRGLDNSLERVRITATADGRLTYEVWLNGAKPPTAPSTNYTWSTKCVNVARGVPLFHYYDNTNGTQVETTGGIDTLAAHVVSTDLRLSFDGSDFASAQTIMLRNRQ